MGADESEKVLEEWVGVSRGGIGLVGVGALFDNPLIEKYLLNLF